MRTWTTQTTVTRLPDEVLALLTEPDAIERWTPVPFELIDLNTDRLVAGSRARVRGRLAGRTLEFDVEVLAANDERLALVATGPISIDVEYALRPAAEEASCAPRYPSTAGASSGASSPRRPTRSSPPAPSTSPSVGSGVSSSPLWRTEPQDPVRSSLAATTGLCWRVLLLAQRGHGAAG
jgi:hypothetical protein